MWTTKREGNPILPRVWKDLAHCGGVALRHAHTCTMMMAAKTSFSVLLMFQNQSGVERDFLNVCEYVHNKMDYFPASRIHIYMWWESFEFSKSLFSISVVFYSLL